VPKVDAAVFATQRTRVDMFAATADQWDSLFHADDVTEPVEASAFTKADLIPEQILRRLYVDDYRCGGLPTGHDVLVSQLINILRAYLPSTRKSVPVVGLDRTWDFEPEQLPETMASGKLTFSLPILSSPPVAGAGPKPHLEPPFRFSQTVQQLERLTESAALEALNDDAAAERRRKASADALTFIAKLPETVPVPTASGAEDGEVVLEWSSGDREAVAGFEGDGCFGYALLKGGKFVPGRHEGVLDERPLPEDLISYLVDGEQPA